MRYCARCVLPDSRPNLTFDGEGVCDACRNHARKDVIDWAARRDRFRSVVEAARSNSSGYDCIVPVSGGKDSTWQVVTCLEHGLKPLAVTWRPPGRTAIGQRNLDNLIRLGVDHIDYSVDPRVEKKFMWAAFDRFGSTAVPMHMALFSIPLTLAVRLSIPLVVWGENSAFEYGGQDDDAVGFRLDSAWLRRYGVTHGTTHEDWTDTLDPKELVPYRGPSEAELEAAGVNAVFLGYYFRWDPEVTRAVAAQHGFQSDDAGPRTGLYDYADIDDDFISVHHWMKWYKFGFTRLFDNLSLEIRNRRITRDEAVEVIRSTGDQTPHEDIEAACAFMGVPRSRFDRVAEGFRNPAVWSRRDGVWKVDDFLIDDWSWR